MVSLLSSMFTPLLLVLTTLVLILYKVSKWNFTYWKDRNVPYPEPAPFVGNFLPIFLQKEQIGLYLQRLYQNFVKEPFFGIYVFHQPFLVLNDLELIQQILIKDFSHFSDHIVLADDSMTSNMLFFTKNPLWRKLRVKLAPVFSTGKLKGMMPLMDEAADGLLTHLHKLSSQSDSVEIKESSAKFSTDAISSCAFGIKANCFEREDAELRLAAKSLFALDRMTGIRQASHMFLHPLAKIMRLPFFPRHTMQFLREVFWTAVEQREQTKTKRNDLIDLIIQIKNGNGEDKEVKFDGDLAVAQATQFFGAGFETTSTTIAFTLYELCLNQDIQDKLRAEIRETFEESGSFTYENVGGMEYLNAVISETLRKYPVVPFLDRTCQNDYRVPGTGLVIEKGTSILIPMVGIHKDERYYPNPDSYDPHRFLDENMSNLVPFSYFPFGAGPRICIGERFGLLAVKLSLCRVLSEFQVMRNKHTPVPLVVSTHALFFNSPVGLPMTFKKIDKE